MGPQVAAKVLIGLLRQPVLSWLRNEYGTKRSQEGVKSSPGRVKIASRPYRERDACPRMRRFEHTLSAWPWIPRWTRRPEAPVGRRHRLRSVGTAAPTQVVPGFGGIRCFALVRWWGHRRRLRTPTAGCCQARSTVTPSSLTTMPTINPPPVPKFAPRRRHHLTRPLLRSRAAYRRRRPC